MAASVITRAKPDGHTLLVQYSGYQVIPPQQGMQPSLAGNGTRFGNRRLP